MSFAENVETFLIGCCIMCPGFSLFLLLARIYKKKMARGNCTLLLRGVVVDVKRVRIKHSTSYIPIYQYEYMGVSYQKHSAAPLSYQLAQNKIGTEVELYIDPSDPEKYFCPEDAKVYRGAWIALNCIGWLLVLGTPVFLWILIF